MTKAELMKKYHELLDVKGLNSLDGITSNSNKADIENAINCLECTDEQLDEYAIIIKLKYPNTFKTITENKINFKKHFFNRLYVFNTARLVLM